VKIREKIYEELGKINPEELSILYEQVKLIARVKRKLERKNFLSFYRKNSKMTSSSKSSWVEAVISEEERI